MGVDLNRASVELLTFVPGSNPNLAAAIVTARKAKGGFKSREELKEVPGIGVREYEQLAGFLKISGGTRALDATGVHPERYELVEKIAGIAGISVADLIGNSEALNKADLKPLESESITAVTLKHLVTELKQGLSDARGTYVLPVFNEGVADVKEVQPGQVLNGVVSNITPFGAFVDLGLNQDGLIHISELSHKFVRDPSEVVRLGQPVKVKVLSIDNEKQRLALSLKALEEAPAPKPKTHGPRTGSAAGSSEGGARPPRGPRPQRGPRGPRGPGGKPQDGTAVPAAPGAEGAVPAQAGAGSAQGGNRRPPRGDKRDGGRSNGARPGGNRDGKDGERRGPRPEREKPAPKPGMPDYSKFFVKGKRKDFNKDKKHTGGDREKEASRDEVRQTLKTQNSGGNTLGDLLKKAGVDDEKE